MDFFFQNQDGSIVDFPIASAEFFYDDLSEPYNITYITDSALNSNVQYGSGYPCLKQDVSGNWPRSLIGNDCEKIYVHNMSNLSLIPAFGEYQKVNSSARNLDVPLCIRDTTAEMSGSTFTICKASNVPAKNTYSIQSQLESFIEYKMEECFSLGYSYLREINATVVKKGIFTANVTFADEYTSVKLTFPLVLNFTSIATSTKLFDFYAKEDVRLKNIYAVLYGGNILVRNPLSKAYLYNQQGLIDNDISDVNYDIVKDSITVLERLGLNDMEISRIYDDAGSIIVVEDSASKLYGKNYKYYVRLWNRAPALDYISYYPYNQYDVFLYQNSSLVLMPLAIDPDDEGDEQHELLYEYTVLDDGWKWREQYFYNNSLYINGQADNNTCIHPKYGITKRRCSKIDLSSQDAGYHRLEIRAKDGQDKSDSQILEIYINNDTVLVFSINNIYPGFMQYFMDGSNRRYILSREDPFILNTTGSNFASVPAPTKLIWTDTLYGSAANVDLPLVGSYMNFKNIIPYSFRINETMIAHPGYSDYTLYNYLGSFLAIANLYSNSLDEYTDNNLVLQNLRQLKQYTDVYNINQKIGYPFTPGAAATSSARSSSIGLSYYEEGLLKMSTTQNIYIAECMPYRSETPSYPFNLVMTYGSKRDYNPYYGNHTCCNAADLNDPKTWSVKADGTSCYYSYEILDYAEAMENSETNISSSIFAEMDPSWSFTMDPEVELVTSATVDRYVRTLRGECKGRGNVCYPKEYTIKKIPYCGMKYYNPGSYQANLTVRDTMQPSYGSFYLGSLCACKEGDDTRIINTTNISIDMAYGIPVNQLYCCVDGNGIPTSLKNVPCNIPNCNQWNPFGGLAATTIGNSYKDPTNNVAINFCMCGTETVNTMLYSNQYCCAANNADYRRKANSNDCSIP